MSKNIQMNVKNGSGYEVLYPQGISSNVLVSSELAENLNISSGVAIDYAITNSNGSKVVVNFPSIANGKSYTITGSGVNITGTVPSGGVVSFSTQLINITITVVCDGVTNNFNIREYYSYYTFNFKYSLEYLTWARIKQYADAGYAPSFWSIGESKTITLNGSFGGASFSNDSSYSLFVVDINHNSSVEGNNTVTFMLGKKNGKLYAITASNYGSNGSGMVMNTTSTNVGGWESSYMKGTIIPAFKNAIPSDLKSVLKNATIYTDNTGNSSNTSGAVTSTSDSVYLPAEFEIFGQRNYANQYEQNKQKQFAYFVGLQNNDRIFKGSHNDSAVDVWLRSPHYSSSTSFCSVGSSGGPTGNHAYISHGFAPCLCL